MAITKTSQSIYVYYCTCLRVKDGDTIEADLHMGFGKRWKTPIRFSHDFDAWETSGSAADYRGKIAKAFLEDLFATYGPSFYIQTDKDEVQIYNRVGGRIWLEMSSGTKSKPKKVFIDVIETMRANGFDEAKDPSKQIPFDPDAAPKLVTVQAMDIMDVIRR
jgi:hypothetical protein